MSDSVLRRPSTTTSWSPNPDHLEKLRDGVGAWNAWRQQYPDVIPNLRKVDLSGIDITNADLSNVDFGRVELLGANLAHAKLYQAEFFRANLRGANLRGADLRGTKFHNADLREASLQDSDLFRADFINTRLKKANFTHARCWTTAFSNVDLSEAVGLAQVIHTGPSSVDVSTLFKSGNAIPEIFLRGVGLPAHFIDYLPSLLTSAQAIQFYSCFISYSTKDEGFAKHLYSRMTDEHLRVWFAAEDIKAGRKIHEQIDSAIWFYDKLLLVLSENSMQSEWVITEIRNARKAELVEKKRKLFPIRLVDFEAIKTWTCFDSDTGKDLAVEVREYFIPDFSNWKKNDAFEGAFARLLRDLKARKTL